MIQNIESIYASYLETGSVHKTGLLYGVSGETIRSWIKKSGKCLKRCLWSQDEVNLLTDAYSNQSGIDVASIAQSLGKTYASTALKASKLGLSSGRGKQIRTKKDIEAYSKAQKIRGLRPEEIDRRSKNLQYWHSTHVHPKGMLGKKHSQLAKDAISNFHSGRKLPREQVMKSIRTRIQRFGSLAPNLKRGTWKAEWVEINGVRFFARSKWEANYAHYLEWLRLREIIIKWEHEPETFWFNKIKRGVVSYLPDFRVTFPNGNIEYHEVKGWMDSRSKTKIKRMKIYHPKVHLDVIDSKRYKALEKQMKSIIPNWK